VKLASITGVSVSALLLLGCGGRPPVPKRGVIESDVAGWQYRRYQSMLDVEVFIGGNKAIGYTASYARGEAARAGSLKDSDVVNAFVTRYEKPDGVVRAIAKFARRVGNQTGYQVEEAEVEDVRLVAIMGQGEAWVIWPSGNHVVKLGGRGLDSVPGGLIEEYGERFPSDMPGGVLEGPLPEGPDASDEAPKDPKAPYDPNAPTPEWDEYDKDEADSQIDNKAASGQEAAGDDAAGSTAGSTAGSPAGSPADSPNDKSSGKKDKGKKSK
jgi:hypothetical protein